MNTNERQDPNTLELRARPRPVRRLNRRVIAVIVISLILAVTVALLWGLRKPASNKPTQAPTAQNVEHVAKPEGLNALPKDYASMPKPPQLGAPIGELGRPLLRAEREAGLPELPERPTYRQNPEEDALRAQRLKEVNEAEAAAKAQTLVSLQRTAKTSAPTPSLQMPLVAPSAIDDARPASETSAPDPNKQVRKQNFVDKEPDSRIYASATLETPRSPFQLLSGTVIPAALVTGIKSDLPGQTIATVTESVLDSVTGRHLLVPQGSRLIGEYDSDVAYGQQRVLLVWTRLIMPDGSSILLDRLSATDTQGYAGLEDKVDWHWRRIFSGAALSTLLGASAELAVPDDRDENGRVIVAARQGAQDTINQVGQETTKRNLHVQPTLTVRPGFPLRVIVNKDLILRPYATLGGA